MKRRRAASTGGGLLLCVACLLTWPPASAHAQRILVDQGVRAAGLWCFPLAGDTSEYVYLPGHARLATDERGRPRFSLITYSPGSGTSDAGASSSAAGAVVHFLVEYGES
ncbi:MAG: hypothetical protein JSW46_04905 [Gemmatimonadota bacterium]|nr:MAG: hypothetical protein JSW46_04905 [Gemmatimonadota bacterium]